MNYRLDVLYGVPIVKPRQLAMLHTIDSEPMWNGVRVQVSELCTQRRVAFDVVRNPRRRRRAYSVARREWQEPCGYRLADGTMVLHPALWEQLKLHKVRKPSACAVPGGGISIGGEVWP